MKRKVLTGKNVEDRCIDHFETLANNQGDPSAWITLYLDFSVPMRRGPKAAYLMSASSKSRRCFLPLIRPLCQAATALIGVLKFFVPNKLQFPRLLHTSVYWGLKYFVSPEASYIILRHFHITSQLLEFIQANIPNLKNKAQTLYPKTLKHIIKDQIFLQNDHNFFNFLSKLNFELKETGRSIGPPHEIDFSAIRPGDFDITDLPNRFTNFLDVESALEIYMPLCRLLMRASDYRRAQHAMQFDETIAIYISKILGDSAHLALINNKHPMAPVINRAPAFRLLLHGLSFENLHGLLCDAQRVQKQNLF